MKYSNLVINPSSPTNLQHVAKRLREEFVTDFDYKEWFEVAFQKIEENPDFCSDAFPKAEYILVKRRDEIGQFEVDLRFIFDNLDPKAQVSFSKGLATVLLDKISLLEKDKVRKFLDLYSFLIEKLLSQELICLLLFLSLEKFRKG